MLMQNLIPPGDSVPHPKGLATNKVGTLAGAVLSTASVAPAYALTASIGLIVAAVGLKMPALIIAGFIPMFLAAYAYRELNSDTPDCGASFTWSTKAFGPYVGWMCGWGAVISVIIVLANLAAIAVEFLYLFLGRLTNSVFLMDLAGNRPVNIATTLMFIAIAAWISSRGITTSERVQYILVGFQMVVLLIFAVAALRHVSAGTAPVSLDFSLDWFNPFTGLAVGAFVIGLMGSVFAFWGWDTALTLGEESKDPKRTPGRAGLLCILSVLVTYLLVATAAMMFAGVGTTGLGLGNPVNSENVFGAIAEPVLGHWGGLLLFLAIFISSCASLQATFLPASRAMLAMGSYRAFPAKLATVHPKYKVPSFATAVAAIIAGVFYTVVSTLSERVLFDMIAALGIMICWYYGITAFACVWYFRKQLFTSARNIAFKFLFPLVGGAMLLIVFVISVIESFDPEIGSGASIGGIGLVFFLGFGVLAFGGVLMVIMKQRHPDFFRGETLPRSIAAEPVAETSPMAG
ncbi:Amino acid transporter, putative [Hoyosella subflava DQS3-9A1]|uniref:Amino acid transporter, putative n=2 Tax=Hoyosella TaxID=697025 RepID=F6EI55_HOYSD|nr:Amino acid transporter, putative [Hoyosella subflava DQS3-9A1]